MQFKKREEKNKGVVELFLERDGNSVDLRAIDSDGKEWNVMRFEDGKFERNTGLPDDIGIEVDDEGRIKEE